MAVHLKVVEGKQRGASIAVRGDAFVIGRDVTCHLRPKHESVDARHCALKRDGDGVAVEDLGSEGGTLLNGRRLRPSVLTPARHGDRLQVGPLVFELDFDDELDRRPAAGRGRPAAGDLLDDEEESSVLAKLANRIIQRELGQGPDPTRSVGAHLHAAVQEGVPCVTVDLPRITDESIPVFKRELANLADRPSLTRVVLDFHKVRAMCPTAAEVLLAFHHRLRKHGARLKLCDVSPEVMDVLDRHGILDEVPAFLDSHDAIWSAW